MSHKNDTINQMENLLCFVAVEFVNDPNVVGLKYWYLCPFDGAEAGDNVVAPLGRHNNTQTGVIREVRYDYGYNAPFPLHSIKYITKLIKPAGAEDV